MINQKIFTNIMEGKGKRKVPGYTRLDIGMGDGYKRYLKSFVYSGYQAATDYLFQLCYDAGLSRQCALKIAEYYTTRIRELIEERRKVAAGTFRHFTFAKTKLEKKTGKVNRWTVVLNTTDVADIIDQGADKNSAAVRSVTLQDIIKWVKKKEVFLNRMGTTMLWKNNTEIKTANIIYKKIKRTGINSSDKVFYGLTLRKTKKGNPKPNPRVQYVKYDRTMFDQVHHDLQPLIAAEIKDMRAERSRTYADLLLRGKRIRKDNLQGREAELNNIRFMFDEIDEFAMFHILRYTINNLTHILNNIDTERNSVEKKDSDKFQKDVSVSVKQVIRLTNKQYYIMDTKIAKSINEVSRNILAGIDGSNITGTAVADMRKSSVSAQQQLKRASAFVRK